MSVTILFLIMRYLTHIVSILLLYSLFIVDIFANPSMQTCQTVIVEQPEDAETVCLPLLLENNDELTANEKTKIFIDMASLHSINGNFTKADQFLDEAFAKNDILKKNNFYRYNWLRIRGTVHYRQENLSEALPFMQESLSIAKILEYDSMIATSYNDVGAIEMQLGNYQRALTLFSKPLRFLKPFINLSLRL